MSVTAGQSHACSSIDAEYQVSTRRVVTRSLLSGALSQNLYIIMEERGCSTERKNAVSALVAAAVV